MIRLHRRAMLHLLMASAVLLASVIWSSTVAAAGSVGAAYILSNAPSGNEVLVWNRAADGTLTRAGSYPTGGTGTGGGLGSQGAIILSENGRWLFAVDAGSNQVASFRVNRDGLSLSGHTDSGGIMPTSLTVSGDLLYVLNAGGTGNITGFRIGTDGALSMIPGSTRALSGSATAPAQVSFSPDGDLLVVTERATNQIVTYTVGADGRTMDQKVFPSSGVTPFGFAFGKRGSLLVSEANGAPGASAASSYNIGQDGDLRLVSGSVSTNQGAACWLVITRNGRYAYTSNAGSGSITGFRVGRSGELTLLDADGRTGVTGDGTGPTDLGLSHNSQFLYVRNGRSGTIGAFIVGSNGSLQTMTGALDVPSGAAGLAAW